ncbi:MAG: hypothetical protein Q4C53_03035 [Clostridia bacterium]|nr:hypothetical protein [Clostridia bacterium]
MEWRWCVVANIKKEHIDEEGVLRYGTKEFCGGKKVYLYGSPWISEEYEHDPDSVLALGVNRDGRYQFNAVPVGLLENVRCAQLFRPAVLDLMHTYEMRAGNRRWHEDRKEAALFCKMLGQRMATETEGKAQNEC